MAFVLEHGMGKCKLLNVNIPAVPATVLKGFKICRQAEARWIERYVEGTDPRGQKYYWLTGEFTNQDKANDTDVWALDNNYISVVPSGHDLTRYDSLEFLKPLEHGVRAKSI